MNKYFILLMLTRIMVEANAQPNCNVYLYNGDTLKYNACNKTMEVKGLYQFTKEYQMILDEAIEIDPTFDYAYWAKSIAYLKSGDFVTWKKLIDKAVQLNPKEHLGYRGWCRYQFFADYEGAIADIEKLDSLITWDIGFSQDGTYHLNMAKGLWYRAIGDKNKALQVLESQIKINEKEGNIGQFDYLHLGVLYLDMGRFEDAIEIFELQSAKTNYAENHYYLALAYKQQGNMGAYRSALAKAKQLYNKGSRMTDTYYHPMDKIYWKDIEDGLKMAGEKDH